MGTPNARPHPQARILPPQGPHQGRGQEDPGTPEQEQGGFRGQEEGSEVTPEKLLQELTDYGKSSPFKHDDIVDATTILQKFTGPQRSLRVYEIQGHIMRVLRWIMAGLSFLWGWAVVLSVLVDFALLFGHQVFKPIEEGLPFCFTVWLMPVYSPAIFFGLPRWNQYRKSIGMEKLITEDSWMD